MSNGDDVLDNWEEIDEAGVGFIFKMYLKFNNLKILLISDKLTRKNI